MELWESPSGRLHAQQSCSGGPGRRGMKRVRRTPQQLAEIWQESVSKKSDPSTVICRCAWSRVPKESK